MNQPIPLHDELKVVEKSKDTSEPEARSSTAQMTVDTKTLERNKRKSPSSRSVSQGQTLNQNGQKSNQKAKKIKTKHLDPKILALRRTIQTSCGSNDLHTAITSYDELHVQQQVKMEAQSFYNLLNLCEGSIGGERGVHIGTPKPPSSTSAAEVGSSEKNHEVEEHTMTEKEIINYDPAQRKEFAFQIKQEMHKLQIPLNETAYTALIRILCRTNDLNEAENILTQAEGTQQCKPKLRMYSCLIDGFCNKNNLNGALRTWARMNAVERKDKQGKRLLVEMTEREYCSIMKCAARVGDKGVMERVLSEVAEDILVPSLETNAAITQWFQSKYAIATSPLDKNESSKSSISALDHIAGLPQCHAPSMGPIQYHCKSFTNGDNSDISYSIIPKWEVSSNIKVDTKTGILQSGCLEGARLKPVQLDSEAWIKMLQMNEEIVVKGEVAGNDRISDFAGGGKGKKRILTKETMEKRIKQWEKFKAFLVREVGPPTVTGEKNVERDFCNEKKQTFDIVIDGANVGYYNRNFAYAPRHVDYNQIDWVVEHFRRRGKSVLLFMHERHFGKNMMPHWAHKIVKRWEDVRILYRTPFGSNDDWFWMHAALWCGRGTMVLSNDLMRDHHFQMCAHRKFLRWKERHQVHFDFGGWAENKREVILKYPDVYSRRIQRVGHDGLVIPLPKKGDENRFLDGFHEAGENTREEETYICIKLNKNELDNEKLNDAISK